MDPSSNPKQKFKVILKKHIERDDHNPPSFLQKLKKLLLALPLQIF